MNNNNNTNNININNNENFRVLPLASSLISQMKSKQNKNINILNISVIFLYFKLLMNQKIWICTGQYLLCLGCLGITSGTFIIFLTAPSWKLRFSCNNFGFHINIIIYNLYSSFLKTIHDMFGFLHPIIFSTN